MNFKKLLKSAPLFISIILSISLGCSLVFGQNVDVRVSVQPPLADPTNLVATPGNRYVDLNWTINPSPLLTDQILYIRRDGDPGPYSTQTVGLINSMRVNSLVNGVLYHFTIVSVDSLARTSSPGASDSARPFGTSNPPTSFCGDGVVDGGEECDDGNVTSGDGCTASCLIEVPDNCGNGVIEGIEECDDNNNISGDGCSIICEAEELASRVLQPNPDIIAETEIDLTFEIIDPASTYDHVKLYYSHNRGPYNLYPGTFVSGPIHMENLEEGEYQVYTIAVSRGGAEEVAPVVADAIFEVNLVPNVEVIAHPEKRMPATGNWATLGSLKIYPINQTTPTYELVADINDGGMATLDNTVATANYHAAFKGRSHLTKFIRDVAFDEDRDIELDFTFGDTFDVLAGDVHMSKDDYVNSLDLSATVVVIYNPDDEADLNMDGVVNGMDLSIEVVNLYKSGETIN